MVKRDFFASAHARVGGKNVAVLMQHLLSAYLASAVAIATAVRPKVIASNGSVKFRAVAPNIAAKVAISASIHVAGYFLMRLSASANTHWRGG